jgi:putative ABC transport system permease protein
MFLVVRSTNNASGLTSEITRQIRSIDPELPPFEFKTMGQRLSDSLTRRRFSTFLLGVFAVVALVLAAIGIYGVMAYSVTQRTQEIGIRMALGAQPGKIMLMVVRHSLLLAICGVVLGLAGAFALTRVMSSLLFGVSTTDTLTFAAPPLVLGAIALLAGYFPARRASRIDPTIALRSE